MPFSTVDAEKSILGFEKFAAPVIRYALNAVIVKPTDRHESQSEKDLDFASIDGVIVTADGWQYFYASRVQEDKNYATFSVRRTRPSGEPTEYFKLCEAWRLQKPMPRYHVHTYINADKQNAIVGIAETVDLLKYIGNHRDQWRTAPTGETFFYIPFAEINCKIFSIDAKGIVKKISRS